MPESSDKTSTRFQFDRLKTLRAYTHTRHPPPGYRKQQICPRDVGKRTFGHVRPVKIQISLYIRTVWSESSLDAFWIAKDAKFLHADSEDSDQTTRMRIWVFVRRSPEGTFSHVAVVRVLHYENTPIQIYWKFCHQKNENFQIKILIFFIFLLKT